MSCSLHHQNICSCDLRWDKPVIPNIQVLLKALHGWKEQREHRQHIRQLLAAAVQRWQQSMLSRAFYSMKENVFFQQRARKVQGRHLEAHFSASEGMLWPNISMLTASVTLMTNALGEPGTPIKASGVTR